MIALLRKDLRLYRTALLVGLLLIVWPFLPSLAVAIASAPEDRAAILLSAFTGSAMSGQILSICLAAVLGGCAFSVERRDKSLEFLSMMPISRWQILTSKLIVMGIVIPPLWIINSGLIVLAGEEFFGRPEIQHPSMIGYLFVYAGVLPAVAAQLAFGVSWLCSVLTKSPSISACLGLAMVLLLAGCSVELMPWKIAAAIAAVVGASSLTIGTIIFTQRVNP